MTTHLSARLVWHDRGWDGHICDHPEQNSFCVVQQHIRESLANPKHLQREVDHHATPLAVLEHWQPPCSRDPIAFSAIGYTIMHNDRLKWDRIHEWYKRNGYIDQLITSETKVSPYEDRCRFEGSPVETPSGRGWLRGL